MKTITFYSYKGGVGRTLLLANVAKYLCRFGQKVFALDFDLEAPGLHYKLTPGESQEAVSSPGVVDYIYSFAVESGPNQDLRNYVLEVERNEDAGGVIHLMRAGNVPTAEYWRRLARINWHDVFYVEDARGVPFFLELKAKIERDFAPDYLLIDSRTGITEIGGVATTVLPDVIVCLLLNNRESLEGAREVLRSIRRTRRLRAQPPVEILPVVARLTSSAESDEAQVVEEVRSFLNEDAPDIEDNLFFSKMMVLHTEPRLEVKESLLIESRANVDLALFRDYIRLLAKLVPAEVLTPYVVPLVQQAKSDGIDNPDRVERNLVALCEYVCVPEPYQALLNLYFDTQADRRKILDFAYRYWRADGCAEDPILLRALHDCLSFLPDAVSLWGLPLGFVEAVWRAQGALDASVGMFLADAYRRASRPEMACEVIASLMDHSNPSAPEIIRCLEILLETGNESLSNDLILRYKDGLLRNPEFGDRFWRIWARATISSGGAERAAQFRKDAGVPPRLDGATLMNYCHILERAGTANLREEIAKLLRCFVPHDNLFLDAMDAKKFWVLVSGMRLEPELSEALRRHMSEEEVIHYIREIRAIAERAL